VVEARRLLPHTLAFELCHAWPGDWAMEGVKSAETTLRSAEEVLAISDEQGFSYLFWFGNIMRGWCLGAMGQTAEAIPLILQGLDNVRATGAGLVNSIFPHDARGGLWNGGAGGRRSQTPRRSREHS
jgi:hypothetical protein